MVKEEPRETTHHNMSTEKDSNAPLQVAFKGGRWVERRELKPPTDLNK
jgi:hypothetical protein